MPPKRPRPDIDHTRDALRQHDERIAEDDEQESESQPEPEPDEPEDADES